LLRTPWRPTPALEAALDLVADFDGAGDLVPAPFEPSPEMIAAGAAAGGVAPLVALRIYRAMLRQV
jgi:hypothetical protein